MKSILPIFVDVIKKISIFLVWFSIFLTGIYFLSDDINNYAIYFSLSYLLISGFIFIYFYKGKTEFFKALKLFWGTVLFFIGLSTIVLFFGENMFWAYLYLIGVLLLVTYLNDKTYFTKKYWLDFFDNLKEIVFGVSKALGYLSLFIIIVALLVGILIFFGSIIASLSATTIIIILLVLILLK